jgi:hypothetical protein
MIDFTVRYAVAHTNCYTAEYLISHVERGGFFGQSTPSNLRPFAVRYCSALEL